MVPKDIRARRFGRLTAVSVTAKRSIRAWLCHCDCGQTASVITARLINGDVKSCGCLQREVGRRNGKDMTGLVFGRLTVLMRDGSKNINEQWHFVCACSCGQQVTVSGAQLRSGKTKSCGCLKKDAGSKLRQSLIGRRFGRLTPLGLVGKESTSSNHCLLWLVRCDCGRLKTIRGRDLKRASVRSCGCLKNSFSVQATRVRSHFYPHSSIEDVEQYLMMKQATRKVEQCLIQTK